jgi:hypothetical protein
VNVDVGWFRWNFQDLCILAFSTRIHVVFFRTLIIFHEQLKFLIKKRTPNAKIRKSLEEYCKHSTYNFGKIDILIHFDKNFPALHRFLIVICGYPHLRQLFRRHKKLFSNLFLELDNKWTIETCSNTCDTHLLLVFWLELCQNHSKDAVKQTHFIVFFPIGYNWLSFSMENFQNFRYGLSLCLKMVHFLGV